LLTELLSGKSPDEDKQFSSERHTESGSFNLRRDYREDWQLRWV
jgi:hypothetical protein